MALEVFGSGLRHPEGVGLGLRDLRRLPSTTRTAFIECAGNGRSLFAAQQGTPASGSQWKLGAVGVARWRGVALGEVLERAGISRRAVDVMPQGLDAGVVSDGVDQGHVRRPLSVAKAFDDVLLAYEMNGRPLPPDHGFPVRLVVPGWVGIASIKWVGQIEVSDQPLFSPWNTTQYRMIGPEYPPHSLPLTKQQVKSAFELPWDARLPAGRRLTLRGRSWSGNRPIMRVDVRVDGGMAGGAPISTVRISLRLGCAGPSTSRRPRRALISCSRGRPTGPEPRNRKPCRSTPAAISSGRSHGTRSPSPEMPSARGLVHPK